MSTPPEVVGRISGLGVAHPAYGCNRLEGLFQPTMRAGLCESVDALQANLDAWRHPNNREWPQLGYRNQGRRPWRTDECFVTQTAKREG